MLKIWTHSSVPSLLFMSLLTIMENQMSYVKYQYYNINVLWNFENCLLLINLHMTDILVIFFILIRWYICCNLRLVTLIFKFLSIWRLLVIRSSYYFLSVHKVQVNYLGISNQHPKQFEPDLLRTGNVGHDH